MATIYIYLRFIYIFREKNCSGYINYTLFIVLLGKHANWKNF